MKLLNRAILYYSLAMLLAFGYTGMILYTSIHHLVLKQVTESLLREKDIIRDQIEFADTVPDFSDLFNHQIEVTIYKHKVVKSQNIIDTSLYDTLNQRQMDYRYLVYTDNTSDNKGYMISTSKSIENEKSLLYEILGIIVILFAVLSLLLIIIIISISHRLWGSFYVTLSNIRKYDIKTSQEFVPVATGITEFAQLNEVLKTLTEKIRSEYLNLKEFSENASHEIQTPLAIIRMRIEQILQSPDINDELAEHLISMGQSVSKISRINQALSLISKIENNQYPDTSVVSLNQKIEGVLSQFHDFIVSRKLNVQFDADEQVEIQMNPDLSDFLFSNLLGNAIKHNVDKGWIKIALNRKELILRNSGKDPGVDTNQLFFRFKKAEHSTDSPGLGLAIVKKVTDLYEMKISYEYSDSVHTLHIIFGK
jgi:signal transduction histidine kinase